MNSNKTADIISKILSPVMIALIATIILALTSKTGYLQPYIGIMIGLLFLSISPMAMVIYFYGKGRVDLDVSNRKQRTSFYIVAIGSYIIATVLFFYTNYENLFLLSIAYLSVTTAVMIANFFYKVSSHTAGVAGPITALTFSLGIIFLPLFILIPIIIWSRLKLKAHNFIEAISGIVIAIILTSIVYTTFYYIF